MPGEFLQQFRDWKRPAGRPHTFLMATMKNVLSYHNLSVEDATELALYRPLWKLLTASGATVYALNWSKASRTMMIMCFGGMCGKRIGVGQFVDIDGTKQNGCRVGHGSDLSTGLVGSGSEFTIT